EGLRSPYLGPIDGRYRRYGQAYRRDCRGTDSAAYFEESLYGFAVAACGQEIARAVRDSYAQAAARYSRADARYGGCADEARSSGRRGRGDQGVRQEIKRCGTNT